MIQVLERELSAFVCPKTLGKCIFGVWEGQPSLC